MSARIASGVIRLATGWPAGQLGGAARVRSGARKTDLYAGYASLAGDVAIAGPPDAPVRRRVRLLLRANGQIIRQTWSAAADGAVVFEALAAAPMVVLADDYTGNYNAVVLDRLTPE